MTLGQQRYRDALATILASPLLREFFWRLVVEDCMIYQEGFAMNASAYALLAKQEIGKRLLADAKAVSLEGVHKAEKEYTELVSRTAKQTEGEIYGE